MLARHFSIIVAFLSCLGPTEAGICGSVTIKNNLTSAEKFLRNCTIITGSLQFILIDNKTTENDFKKLQFPQLQEVWEKVLFFRVSSITSIGKLFPNLRVIRGRSLFENYAMVLYKVENLREIGLKNLRLIEKGNVKIGSCPKLCYVDTVNWEKLGTNMEIWENDRECPKKCPPQCKDGCWSETECQKDFNTLEDSTSNEQNCSSNKFILRPGNICVTKEECIGLNVRQKFFPFEGSCINNCPRGYKLVPTEEGNCKKCRENDCDKTCDGREVSSLESMQLMNGCTHVNGSLIIKVNNEKVAKELGAYLSSIKHIKGFLKVHRSPALKNLTFLNNLKVIEGSILQNNNSLMILENDNLNKLWDLDILDLVLKQGNISFHYNHQLCISEIERLAKKLKIDNLTPIEVSRHSNGDQTSCGEELEVDVHIKRVYANNVTISWTVTNSPINLSDRYIFYYMENSGFKESHLDTCSANNWKVEVVQERQVNLTRLQPYTNYTFYIITKNDSSLSYSRSHNFYFMTLSDDPSFPLDVVAVSHTWDSMEISWNPPSKTNGDLAFYIITGYMEPDDQNFLDDRNFCNSVDIFSKHENFIKNVQTYTNETCLCENDSNVIKFTDKFKYIVYEEEFGKHQEIYKMYKRTAPNSKQNFGIKVNPTETSHTISNLSPYAIYVFYISACNLNLLDEPQCGEVVMVSNRTKKNPNADDIISISDKVSGNSLILEWTEPEAPNSLIVAYKIEYERTNTDNSKSTIDCITRKRHESDGRVYKINNIPPGHYRVRVASMSLAGLGHFTTYQPFSVFQERNSTAAIVTTCIIVLLVVSFVGFFYYFRWKRKMELEKLHLIASVNPDYAGPTYLEDEWEIERNSIEMKQELGHGTFGRVYSGYVKDLKLFCAIKTVNDNASMEERVNFLNEASVMKSFSEGHHVVRLLGVVSRGQPPLVLMELMACGNLKTFLMKSRESSQSITSNEMYRMAIEIADGMAYLSAKKFVHRDLAARNCMVSADHTIKIGDFGMARDVYETDYYRKETKGLLPVRWMAPESLADGVFTSDSDVWSYGVVLWEMATLAEQPYQGLANEQVFDFVIAHGILTRPRECPDLLFDIMQRCWKWRPISRPPFSDIVKILEEHVGEDFKLVSFYHSREGEEYRLNSRERPVNPPALSHGTGQNLFARYNQSDDDVSIYSGNQSLTGSSISHSQPKQRHLSTYNFKEGSSSNTYPSFTMSPM